MSSDRLKQIGIRFLVGLALNSETQLLAVVRGWLQKRLEQYTQEDLIYGIKNNIDIMPGIPQREWDVGKKMLQSPATQVVVRKYYNLINGEMVLKWWAEDRPDLAAVIVNWRVYNPKAKGPEAKNWLDVQTGRIKEKLFGRVNMT